MMTMKIRCEGDIENGIKSFLRLAVLDGKKTVVMYFPSEELCKIFFNNLMETFEQVGITEPVNIDAVLVLPED